MPLFEQMGTNIVLQGKAGSGAAYQNVQPDCHCLWHDGCMRSARLCQDVWSGRGKRAEEHCYRCGRKLVAQQSRSAHDQGDYEPGFYVKHFIKDMGIALESAREMGLDLPGLKLASELYQKMVDNGFGDKGTQVLYKYFES